MAYNRSERFAKHLSQTPPMVGPATYEMPDLFKPQRDPEGLYAFLSSAQRNTLEISKDAACLPGPGEYDPREFAKHVPGGVSIDFTDIRSKYESYPGPGPADYELPDDVFKLQPPKQRVHPGTWKGPPGKLWLCHPPRSEMMSGVSVPTHRDVNGYDVNEFGMLVKNPPDERVPTMFYNVPREEVNFNTIRYRGNFWSRMSGRDDVRSLVTPGPGTYEHGTILCMGKLQNEKFRASRRATSKQPRYIEAVYGRNMREATPGPDHYHLPPGRFERKAVTCECREYNFKPPAFGQGANRFKYVYDENPPPGTYNPIKRKCCPGSILNAPFGSLAPRFRNVLDGSGPEPGQYFSGREGIAYDMCKRCKRNAVTAAFNSSVPRTTGDALTTAGPSPATYPSKLEWKRPKSYVYHAAFKSQTSRFNEPTGGDDGPSPGAYEVAVAYKRCRDSCEFLQCPEAAPFNSRKERFPIIPEGVDINVPGPGRYDLRRDVAEDIKGGGMPCDVRSKPLKESGPGPLQYCLHPYAASSLYPRHFNVTLGTPKILKDLKRPEIPWLRRLRARKTLRWFVKPVEEYEHCPSHKCIH